jgi:hypothetical protein
LPDTGNLSRAERVSSVADRVDRAIVYPAFVLPAWANTSVSLIQYLKIVS